MNHLFAGNKFTELFGSDLRSLALLRIGIAFLTILDVLRRLQDLSSHYSDYGILPRSNALLFKDDYVLSFHFLNGSSEFYLFLFILQLVFAAMLLFGYKTRLATIALWIFAISLQARNPEILQGSDVLHRLILFWGIFMPWGKIFSIDSLKRNIHEKVNNTVVSIGVVAFYLQIVFVYVFNAVNKNSAIWREENTAIYYALSLDQFATPIGTMLLNFPDVMKFLTFFVWNLEMYGAILLFFPFFTKYVRMVGVLLYMGMHAGIATTMYLGLFPFLDIVALTVFIPSWVWDTVILNLKKIKQFSVTIYYDDDCGLCLTTVKIIKTFLLIPNLSLYPLPINGEIKNESDKHNSWVIIDSNGKNNFKWSGVRAIIASSPLLFYTAPILRLSPIKTLGNNLYEFISSHRKRECTIQVEKPLIPSFLEKAFRILTSAIVLILIIYVLFWNLASTGNSEIKFSQINRKPALLLRLDQSWNMFSPYPLLEDGWYTIIGTDKQGKEKNLFYPELGLSFEKPKDYSKINKNNHWRKYLNNLYLNGYERHRPLYASYLCKEYDLQYVKVYFNSELTLPDYKPPTPNTRLLVGNECN